ncbi:hypothetical protein Poli38472_009537 [Pythium oligandrum]|uniref:RWP-RK domain-containing protein n=1 Tax=Pythium oligandrum TaxID=41045 RepID=A0A8K1CFE7_PYTOL|nr:hypothetical protein Poli38472_009537 [Pythium oligandrum]|eukprot:TMW62044.1 hypothetical protein Poli38472_009537 [Pythium oligandrum]
MPPLNFSHLNTAIDDRHDFVHSPTSNSISMSAHLPQSKKAMLSMSPACNFEAFSLHFHLPLKTAAEKFGVRATAFKKRCRAIGIRHWPYRKVRSLKRSLQELNRCKEQGVLNDKQQYQFAAFKKQLDKLMSPETYGIDPSGRIPQHHFEDDGNDDEDDSGDDDSYASQSPRYGATFTECSISPVESDKTFGDFSAPSHLRSFRRQQATFASHPIKSMGAFSSELPGMSHRLAAHPYKYMYGGYDNYPSMNSNLRSLRSSSSSSSLHSHEDQYGDHPSSGSGLDNAQHEFMPSEMKYATEEDFSAPNSHIDYSSERFFDDVFLQISPDYGCLV